MIEEVADQYNAKKIEKRVHEFWEDSYAYSKVRQHREGEKKFFFVDGPPYTTGHIHLGTAWNKIIKDSILRYKSMNGHDILDRAGWDMHGLPIEVKVEGVLGFKSKKDIESYGVENFIGKCKEFALKQKDDMTDQFRELGAWLDWEDPYMTLKDEYIEAAWWTLKQAHEKDLLEVGKRVVNWCPRCETAIADSEVEYEDRTDPSIYIKFPLKNEDSTFIVIWTTTPWTIPSNIAVAVNPEFEYAKVKAEKDGETEILIMATELVENVLRKGRYENYEILETLSGEDVAGFEYESPLADLVPLQAEMEHHVYTADYVTAENTGCVHIAPGHGVDDFEVGIKNGLPIFCPVGSNGSYTEEAGKYTGMNIRDANPIVIEDLDKKNLLLSEDQISHRYGHCWRCKTPIIYLATRQWFIKIGDLKDDMLEEITKVKWHPEWAGSARFKDWIEGARDWCISRQRYWGIPIPVWSCDSCGEIKVVGTRKELVEVAGIDPETELHRPYVDEITIPCSCGGEMTRVEDVFDVWFDSAVASWATLRFPHTRELFDEWWPAEFITEGHDQTRGWFYSQLGASMVGFGRAPYKSVLMHGFTLDDAGKKMSKSLGNVVQPQEVIDKFGADALRTYVLASSAPWEDLKFNWDEVATIHRTLNILWNVYRFPLPYMALDKFDPNKVSFESVASHLRNEDKWILSRMQSLIADVDASITNYELQKVIRSINEFILEDLSRWYIQLIRPRTWNEADDPDKLAVYRVLYDVFVTVAKVIAPFLPHLAEEIYSNVVLNVNKEAPFTVHMCDWPKPDENLRDLELEAQMKTIRGMVEAVSNARQKAGRKLRWPVSRIVIEPENDDVARATARLQSVLMDQTNTKLVFLVNTGESWEELGVEATPNPSAIGPVFKGEAGKVVKALSAINGNDLKAGLASGSMEIELEDGSTVSITEKMVNFDDTLPEMVASADFTGGRVYVDATLNREIESEGFAREVIRRIQDMRKELDLEVDESIIAHIRIDDERVVDLVLDMETSIAKEVRSKVQVIGYDIEATGKLAKDWDVEGVSMHIGISPADE
ncbi:isoleucine--tRNA ligase [Methanohalophilus levihalophilus]|uniref:isoleucine--tRNA ligase n=1 Tax=Methanohalophilus levihalophilus TaxID=1431282 RepID=UPI001AE370D0|nr:isoleucine--tRNA ligase [Methanohalophilus levihalophilus]